MEQTMYYFGTNLTTLGHHFWRVEPDQLVSDRIYFSDIPFSPEDMPRRPAGAHVYHPDGYWEFYNENGYSILAIAGSCKDKRPASKSVFFMHADLTQEVMISKVLEFPIVQKMIGQMKFIVNFEK